MPVPRKIFLFYLQDTSSGKCYWLDTGGVIQCTLLTGDADLTINAPEGWQEVQLGFIRNAVYYGINRTFSTAFKLVKDAAYIVRQKFYNGPGTETPLTITIFKYNQQPVIGEPSYELYYKGALDLPSLQDIVAQGVSANLMEGGVMQLLKGYENTVFEIPCDGSIPENIKISYDGMLVEDTFNYEFVPLLYGVTSDRLIMSETFVSNEGDNFGIIKNDPSLEVFSTDSANFLISSVNNIEVRIKGNIIVSSDTASFIALHKSINPFPAVALLVTTIGSAKQIYYFDTTILLEPNVRLYLTISSPGLLEATVYSGSFQISFVSKPNDSRAWGMTALNLFKLLIKAACERASTPAQTFNYAATSELLTEFQNLCVTCGDALRASGNPNYQRFFQQDQFKKISYGPVIKTTIKEFFTAFSAILCGSMSNQQLTGENETIFFERLDYVFNAGATPMEVGEVADMKVKFAQELAFSDLDIGYQPQSNDQIAGKYEWNTTAAWKAPIKSFHKKMDLISPYGADVTRIERLRANIEAQSTTRNSNDNGVFLTNVDFANSFFDFEKLSFLSLVQTFSDPNNTNQRIPINSPTYPISVDKVDGSYLGLYNDPSIFIFAEPGFSGNKDILFEFNGFLLASGLPTTESITIKFFIDGVQQYSKTFNSAGASTPFSDSVPFPAWPVNVGSTVYATVSTSFNARATIDNVKIDVGALGAYWHADGVFVPVDTGTELKPIAMPNVIDSNPGGFPAVRYGFQYYFFNSLLPNSNFDLDVKIYSQYDGAPSEAVVYSLFKNGLLIGAQLFNGTGVPASNVIEFSGNYDLQIGDIFYLLAVTDTINVQITQVDVLFTSTTIKAYGLKRVEYDYMLGLPNIAISPITNLPSTAVAGAPYNIEDLTPRRMMERWFAYIRAVLYTQVGGVLAFQSLSKNKYLITSLAGKIYAEAADVPISSMGAIMFYPLEVMAKTNVHITFAKLLTGVANGVVNFKFNHNNFPAFPMELKQMPGLNEMQDWKLLLTASANLSNLATLDGYNALLMTEPGISTSYYSTLQFVPLGQTLESKYHVRSRNAFWFKEQIDKWNNQNNYWQPVQIGDPIPLQHVSFGLDPLTYTVYRCDGTIYIAATNLDTIAAPGLPSSYVCWQKTIDTTTWPEGQYYIVVSGGIGDAESSIISEGIDVRGNWEDTLLFQVTSSKNIGDGHYYVGTDFKIVARVKGLFDNKFKQMYKGAFYVDQSRDISILNAISYEMTSLWVGLDDGTPDWQVRKFMHWLIMDSCQVETEFFSLNEGAEPEEVFTEGNPKKFIKIDICPAKNLHTLTVNANGLDTDSSLIATIDAQAMGPNANNSSGTEDADIIEIVLNS